MISQFLYSVWTYMFSHLVFLIQYGYTYLLGVPCSVCIYRQKKIWRKAQKSLFLPYIWYGKAIFLLKKGMYQPGLGFEAGVTEKLGRCKES